MKKRIKLSCILFLIGISISFAQTQVSGFVSDENGEPLIGASVQVKGTTIGAITNVNGNFDLTAPEGSSSLVISYVGMITQEVPVSSNVTVRLVSDSRVLGEVVVVGYGQQRKESLTSAVSSVDVEKTLQGRPIADVGRALQGTTPGLTIIQRNGEIGSDPQMRIRGMVGSSVGGSSPLILLDNVEIPSIQIVNPDDIESISILKDAASTSIYGAKGAFGVILITSKKGAKKEYSTITYSNNFGWQNVAKPINMAGIDGMRYNLETVKRVGGTEIGAGTFIYTTEETLKKTEQWLQRYGNIGPDDPIVYGRDWYYLNGKQYGIRPYNTYDYMVREWSPSQTHNLSFSGGSGKINYNIGLGYMGQEGMLKTAKEDNFRRYNGSAKISADINKYLTVRATATYSKREKRFPTVADTQYDPWYYLYRWSPVYMYGFTEFGDPVRGAVQEIAQSNTGKRVFNYTSFNVGATFNLMKNWTADFDYTHANNEFINERPGTRFTAADTWSAPVERKDANGNVVYVDSTGTVVPAGSPGAMKAYNYMVTEYTAKGNAGNDYIYRFSQNMTRNTYNLYTTYLMKLNEIHNFKFMLGMNAVDMQYKNNWSNITELVDITNPQFGLTLGTQTAGGSADWESQLGYFGRINYDYLQRYLVEFNLRYDGSSKFPTGLKWRWYPSFSAGWRVSEEPFMAFSRDYLDQLKLRVSWGTIGDQTVDNALYVPTMPTVQSNWLSSAAKKFIYFQSPNAVRSDITWQDIETLDFGFDLMMFKGLAVTFDWYRRDTKNMIVPGTPTPNTFGTSSPRGNFGNLRTQGYEIQVDYNHRFRNGLGINVMATLSDAITTITSFPNPTQLLNGTWYSGMTYGEIWGYTTDRLYQKEDFVYDNAGNLVTVWALNGQEVAAGTKGAKQMNKLAGNNPVYQDLFQSGNFRFGPGDVKFVDSNNDGKIDNGANTLTDRGDLSVIGNSMPRYEYGFRVGADWYGVDFSVFFQGVGKKSVWGDGMLAIPGYFSNNGAIPQTFAGDYWTPENTDAFYPRPWDMAATNVGFNMQRQTKYLLNMAYLRMKNLTIGYTVPSNILKQAYLTKARVYVSLENFLTFDNLRGLPIDPETDNTYNYFERYSNQNLSRTGMSSPMFKVASVGLQITL